LTLGKEGCASAQKENNAIRLYFDFLVWRGSAGAEEKNRSVGSFRRIVGEEKLPSGPDAANEPSSREKKLNPR